MRNPLLSLAALVLATSPLTAAPDTVDANFAATAGQVFLPNHYGGVASVLVQPDGKILFGSNEMPGMVGGNPLQLPLIRVNPDGSVDNTFFADNEATGSDGGIYYDGQGWSEVHALGLLSDGKIVAAGVMQGVRTGTVAAPGVFLQSNSIVRFNGDGSIDTTFQTAGTMPWPTGGFNFIEDVTIQPDDKIIAVGGFGGFRNSTAVPMIVRHGIARLNLNGSVDTGFQINPTEFGVPSGAANVRGFFSQASVDAAGRILVVGSFEWGPAYPASGTIQVLARLNPDGSHDPTFAPVVPANLDSFENVVVEASGNIVVLGSFGSNAANSWMARFFPDGSADPSFTLDPTLAPVAARPLQVDAEGRYLLTTRTAANQAQNRLVRILSNGSLDPSFTAQANYANSPGGPSAGFFGTFTTAPSGKIYSGSYFDSVNGVGTIKLAAFEGDSVAGSTGKLQFSAAAYSASEQNGVLRIAVTRSGGVSGAASATLALTHGTTSAADLSLSSTSVSFANGAGGTRFIDLPLSADGLQETNETASLALTAITGAAAGTRLSADLTVIDANSPPAITRDPQTLFVAPGNRFSLSVGISSGATPVTYQWSRNGSIISGATAPSYTVTSADAASHGGNYSVAVTNPIGTTTSAAAVVTVKNPAILRFSTATASVVENNGSHSLTLQRAGSDVGAVSVEVQLVNGTATAPADFALLTTTVSWANGDTADKTVNLSLVNDSAIEPAESFQAVLTNPSLDVSIGTPSTVNLTLLDDDSGPAITTPLVSQRVVTGWNASFSVGVQSQTAVTYQWFKDGVLLPAATTATLSFSPVTLADYGYYSVEATNTAGTVTSGPVELGARPDPLARITLDLSVSSNQFSGVTARPNGGYLFFGAFSTLPTSTGTVTALRVARTGADGKVDTSFLPPVGSTVTHGVELPDGSVIIGGSFSNIGVVSTPSGFARLLPDASVDAAFLANLPASISIIRDLEIGPDGKIYLTHGNGVDRLETDGTADPAFRANVLSGFSAGGTYNNLEFIPGGGFYLAGNFNLLNGNPGQTLRRLVRLNPNGTNDPTWKYTTAGALTYFAVQSDGKALVPTSSVTRLNLDGSNDATFTPVTGVNNQVFEVAADDSIYIANGSSTNTKLRRFRPNGTLDTAFNNGVDPSFNNTLSSIDSLTNGAIAIHGSFSTFNGAAVSRPFLITGELKSIAITSQPLAQVVNPGDDIILTVVASSVTPLSYQWKRNGIDLLGENRPSLRLEDVDNADTASYSVTVTSATAQAISTPALLTVRDQPQVLTTPADRTHLEGQALTLTVDWVGLLPATFEWFRNGQPVSGQATNVLSIASPTAADSGIYTVKITNALGDVTSVPIVVNVVAAPGLLANGFISPTGGTPYVSQILPENGGAYVVANSPYSSIIHPSGTYNAVIERVSANGNIAEPFATNVNTNLQKAARDETSGALVMVGTSMFLNGTSRRIARIAADGTEDTTYSANAQAAMVAQNFTPSVVSIDGNGKVYVAGSAKFVRLHTDGTHDSSFSAGTTPNSPRQIVPLPDGKVLLLSSNSLVKYLANGAPDPSFALATLPGSPTLDEIGITGSGEILLPCSAALNQLIYRISASGALLGSIDFSSTTYGNISRFRLLANNSMLIGHGGGKRLTRLLADGTVDPLFDIGTGFNGSVDAIAQAADGSYWIGGAFTQFKGVNARGVVRLNGDPVDILIRSHPLAQTVDTGATAQFTVTATATAGIAYQWRKNGVPLTNGGDISGATTATLFIANAADEDAGNYSVSVTNTSTGRPLVSNNAALTVLREPEILSLTGTQNLDVGQPLTLAVSARGAGTLGYQWLRNGQAIIGANATTYQVAAAIEANTGIYTVEVTNLHGTTPSAEVIVNVVLPAGGIKFATPNVGFANTVNAILPLPDGRTLVGGAFISVIANATSYPVDELALLDAAGNLVTSFDLNPGGAINALALMPDGGVLVAGSFTQIGGQARSYVARLTPSLALDTSWSVGTGPNNVINSVEISGSGYYLGGFFTSFNGDTTKAYVCRIHADGSLDADFTPPALGSIYRIRRDGDGVMVGGNFSLNNTPAGITQTGIARLLGNGAHDTAFRSTMVSGTTVYDHVALPNGKWLAGGSSGRLTRFNADGTTDSSWLTTATVEVRALALQRDGRILVGGNFTTIAGQSINRLARLNSNGTFDGSFAQGAGADGLVQTIALDALGAIHIGGSFNNYRSEARGRYARLNGTPLSIGIANQPAALTVNPGLSATFSVTVRATDTVSYQWRKNGAPLANGGDVSGADSPTLTLANTEESDEADYDVVVTHNGDATVLVSESASLVVLGAPELLTSPAAVTTEVGLGATFRVSARGVGPLTFQWFRGSTLFADGTGVSGATTATLVLSNLTLTDSGSIKVRVTNTLGFAETIPVSLLVERLPQGRDRSVVLPVSVNTTINDILHFDDGSYLLGGSFTSVSHVSGSSSRRYLAKFHASGVVDNSVLQVNGNGAVEVIARAANGKIYIGGGFTSLNTGAGGNVTRNRIARLNSDFTLDTTFNPVGTGPASSVKSILPLANGNVLIAGDFANVNSVAGTAYIALLQETGAVDTSFVSQAGIFVRDITPAGDGTFWVAHPNNYAGQQSVVRIDATGAKVSGFTYPGSLTSDRVIPQPDGSVLSLSGNYPFIQKIQSTGALVPSWPNTGGLYPNDDMTAAATYADGRSIVGGAFVTYAGVTRNRLAAIAADGSLVSSFDPGSGLNGTPTRIRLDAAGRAWVVGNFTTYRGETVPRMVVLNGFDANPPHPYDAFVSSLPEAERGETQDPDFDGLPNLIEFVFGSAPTSFNAAPATTQSSATGASLSPALDAAKLYRVVAIETPKNTQGVDLTLAASVNLTFTDAATATEFGPRTDNGSTETRRYYLTPAIADAPALFWRVEATR
ncbi:MAG: immunoglobulin domain-containing protein [Verrucomicrobiota bacterium]